MLGRQQGNPLSSVVCASNHLGRSFWPLSACSYPAPGLSKQTVKTNKYILCAIEREIIARVSRLIFNCFEMISSVFHLFLKEELHVTTLYMPCLIFHCSWAIGFTNGLIHRLVKGKGTKAFSSWNRAPNEEIVNISTIQCSISRAPRQYQQTRGHGDSRL